ncbi:MAG: hypothetical protein ACPF9U_05210 [Flavobacteriaceae bacterium]
MRCIFFCSLLLVFGCTQSKPQTTTQKVVGTAIADSIIASVDVATPQPIDSLDWSNLIQLMESLNEIPFEQRKITLETLKKEAVTFSSQVWPVELDTNPFRSRYTVFLTDVYVASDKRFSDNAAEQQAEAIAKMKYSWNVFVSHMRTKKSSAVLEMAPR